MTTTFWDIAPCSFIEVYRCVSLIALILDAVSTSETSVNFYETTLHNIQEGFIFILTPSETEISQKAIIQNLDET
jgi:hypothetical protein